MRSTSNSSPPTHRAYSESLGSIGVVSSTALRTAPAGCRAQYIAHNVPPMHQPSSDSSSSPAHRSVSRTAQSSSSQTNSANPMSASSSSGTPQSTRKTSKPSDSRNSTNELPG